MSTNENSSFKMYEELLSQQTDYENGRGGNGYVPQNLNRYVPRADDDADCEDFVTSKEIVKNKEIAEKRLGYSPAESDGVIEESVHFKRYTKRREHRYTEKEMADIRESCRRTIVHDYGLLDIYHISDEERAKNDMLAEVNMKLSRLKRTYRRVDQYIEAMRIVFEAWAVLEKNNFVHTRDEFYQLVAEGKIVSNRIIMPKLKRMDQFNIDMIINYISNPELDPSHLVLQKNERSYDSFFDEDDFLDGGESEEEEMHRMLSKDEVEFIMNGMDAPPKMEIGYIKPKLIKGYDRRGNNKKKKKKGTKIDRQIKSGLSEILNKIQNSAHYREHGNSYMITNSLFEVEKQEKSVFDDLHFDGSWANESQVALYNLVVQEELMKQHPYRERYLTYADKQLQAFFKILEDNGVSTIELQRKINVNNDIVNERKEKIVKKENKKLESAIIQRIGKLNDSSKFKKIVEKAEDALNKYRDGEPR